VGTARGNLFRIGVTGWRGRLGSELVRRGCIPLKCDVTDPAWIRAVLDTHQPHAIVHCAAKTDVDGCEDRPLLAAQVNAWGTWLLCRAFTGPIVYLSTDYIFDGQDGPYDEGARANPLGVYGWSKLGGEIALRQRKGQRDLIVRTTVLFDCYSENFITTVTHKLLAGETLHLPDLLSGSPTYVPDLADGILAAIHKQIGGIINLAGDQVMTRLEMGEVIARELGLPDKVIPGPVTGLAHRPQQAGLIVDEAKRLELPVGDPVDGIRKVVQHVVETVEARRPYHNQ